MLWCECCCVVFEGFMKCCECVCVVFGVKGEGNEGRRGIEGETRGEMRRDQTYLPSCYLLAALALLLREGNNANK